MIGEFMASKFYSHYHTLLAFLPTIWYISALTGISGTHQPKNEIYRNWKCTRNRGKMVFSDLSEKHISTILEQFQTAKLRHKRHYPSTLKKYLMYCNARGTICNVCRHRSILNINKLQLIGHHNATSTMKALHCKHFHFSKCYCVNAKISIAPKQKPIAKNLTIWNFYHPIPRCIHSISILLAKTSKEWYFDIFFYPTKKGEFMKKYQHSPPSLEQAEEYIYLLVLQTSSSNWFHQDPSKRMDWAHLRSAIHSHMKSILTTVQGKEKKTQN